jgi:hypothetical protein
MVRRGFPSTLPKKTMFPSLRAIPAVICGILLGNIANELRAEVDQPRILVHYMPWYSSKAISGEWGWHWTMDHFDPDKVGADGRREIASHDYPLIGPYDSNDPHALECHVLLMKFCGIDGVIIDWYGVYDHNDYANIHRNTLRLIPLLKKAGLKFAICYEDRSISEMVNNGVIPEDDSTSHGVRVMDWLAKNWFADDSYVTIGEDPVLLTFGPLYFERSQWEEMVKALPKRPRIYGLPHLMSDSGLDGAFAWPPVSGGRQLEERQWRSSLVNLYEKSGDSEAVIAVAFPGFHDIYEEAGVHDSYGRISHGAGETFQKTFNLAIESKSQIIQIATWNDYGEGTVIEPTRRFGFKFLEHIQESVGQRLKYSSDDLRLPVMLYRLRKNPSLGKRMTEQLDQASAFLFKSRCDDARVIIDGFGDRQEQDGADQPDTAQESKPEGNSKPNPELEARPR